MLDGGADDWTRKQRFTEACPFLALFVHQWAATRCKGKANAESGELIEKTGRPGIQERSSKYLQRPAKWVVPRFGTRRSVVRIHSPRPILHLRSITCRYGFFGLLVPKVRFAFFLPFSCIVVTQSRHAARRAFVSSKLPTIHRASRLVESGIASLVSLCSYLIIPNRYDERVSVFTAGFAPMNRPHAALGARHCDPKTLLSKTGVCSLK